MPDLAGCRTGGCGRGMLSTVRGRGGGRGWGDGEAKGHGHFVHRDIFYGGSPNSVSLPLNRFRQLRGPCPTQATTYIHFSHFSLKTLGFRLKLLADSRSHIPHFSKDASLAASLIHHQNTHEEA